MLPFQHYPGGILFSLFLAFACACRLIPAIDNELHFECLVVVRPALACQDILYIGYLVALELLLEGCLVVGYYILPVTRIFYDVSEQSQHHFSHRIESAVEIYSAYYSLHCICKDRLPLSPPVFLFSVSQLQILSEPQLPCFFGK